MRKGTLIAPSHCAYLLVPRGLSHPLPGTVQWFCIWKGGQNFCEIPVSVNIFTVYVCFQHIRITNLNSSASFTNTLHVLRLHRIGVRKRVQVLCILQATLPPRRNGTHLIKSISRINCMGSLIQTILRLGI